MKKPWILLLLFFTGCSSQMGVRQAAVSQRTIEEMRNALLDVKQLLAQQQLDIQLLEEKVQGKKIETGYSPQVSRIENLEATQKRILDDLKKLGVHANETNHSFNQIHKTIQNVEKELGLQSGKLSEVVKLKSTLNSISSAIGKGGGVYKVQSGDSLERIARKYNTTVQSLKQANGLNSNTIIVGQELKIP